DKLKKQLGELNLEMERTKDILQTLGEQKKDQFLVGFAAETRDILAYGEEKLKQKNLDAIIINNVKTSRTGFEWDTNIATYLNPKGEKHELPLQSKDEFATNILKLIVQDMKGDKQCTLQKSLSMYQHQLLIKHSTIKFPHIYNQSFNLECA